VLMRHKSIMMMLNKKTSLRHSVGLMLLVAKIKEDFMGLENLAKITVTSRSDITNLNN